MRIEKDLKFSKYYPVYIENKTQLFIDTKLLDYKENVNHKNIPGVKHPLNPLILPDKSWEGWRILAWGDFIYDEQEKFFKMWYYTATYNSEAYNGGGTTKMLYATSKDGINWDKPLLQEDGTNRTNIFPDEKVEVASVYKDMNESNPNRRYKMVCYVRKWKYNTYVSKDGLNWKKETEDILNTFGGDVINVVYNEYTKKFCAVVKITTVDPVDGIYFRRCFYYIESDDFKTWSKPREWIKVDEQDKSTTIKRIKKSEPLFDHKPNPNQFRTNLYGSALLPHESGLIAFPWIFHISSSGDTTDDGPQDIQLAFSRDMVNWSRENREPVIPLGNIKNISSNPLENAKVSDWDSGYICTTSKALNFNDEVWLYYTGSNFTHCQICLYDEKKEDGTDSGRATVYKNALGLVKWKRDRFAELESIAQGEFVTVPLRINERTLVLNAKTEKDGFIQVDIIMRDYLKKEWFTITSEKFNGDSLDYKAIFKENHIFNEYMDTALLPEIRLRFTCNKASVYSFAFKDY